jgi:thymidylate kinase
MNREKEEKLNKLDRMLTKNPDLVFTLWLEAKAGTPRITLREGKEEITLTREEAIELSVEILKRFKEEIGLA